MKEGCAALCRSGRRPASWEIGEKMRGYKKKLSVCLSHLSFLFIEDYSF